MAYKGDEKKIQSKVKDIEHVIRNGRSIAIDPASKNLGYAIIENGKIVENGVIKAPPTAPIGQRLDYICAQIQAKGPFEACFVELVRTGRSGGHIYLVWSAGAAVVAASAPHTHEIRVSMWKKIASQDKSYVKSDANDALKIAEVVLDCIKDDNEQTATKNTRRGQNKRRKPKAKKHGTSTKKGKQKIKK